FGPLSISVLPCRSRLPRHRLLHIYFDSISRIVIDLESKLSPRLSALRGSPGCVQRLRIITHLPSNVGRPLSRGRVWACTSRKTYDPHNPKPSHCALLGFITLPTSAAFSEGETAM